MSDTSPPQAGDAIGALDDYTSGTMPDAAAEAFEQALFARAAVGDAPEAEFAERLRQNATWITQRSAFKVGATRAEVDALLNSGLRVAYADFGDGSRPVDVPVIPPDLDLFIYKVNVDLRGMTDIDVIVETASGQHIKTFRDVSYDPTDGAVYGICEAPLAELGMRRGTVLWKLMVGRGAERRLLGTLETRPVPA